MLICVCMAKRVQLPMLDDTMQRYVYGMRDPAGQSQVTLAYLIQHHMYIVCKCRAVTVSVHVREVARLT